jgi:hypothetical protein
VTSLSHRRCFNHAGREAAARCPSCGNFFCRECITEHEGRMICSRCLQPEVEGSVKRRFIRGVARVLQVLAGTLLLWLAFFLAGRILLELPSTFHEGTFFTETGARR